MNFSDPQLLHSPGFVFTGVPVGDSRLLPSAYTPQVAVTNFSAEAKTVTVSFATTNNGSSSLMQVAAFSMPSGSSRLVNLRGLSGDADWKNSFIVRSTGQPGDVMAKMMFKSVGTLPNIELLAKDEHHWQDFGDHPWSVEHGMRSTLLLFNHSSSTRKVTVRVASGPDVWLKIYDLKPNETLSLSVHDLIESGTLDETKHAIVKKRVSGEIAWWAPNSGAPEVTGRLVQIDAAGSSAQNFSCYIGSGLCVLAINHDPLSLTTYSNDVQVATTEFCTYVARPTGCPNDNQYTPMTTALTWSWQSGHSNIAAIMSGASSQNSTWTGMSGGSTTGSVSAQVQSNYQNRCDKSGGVNVQTPNSLSTPTQTPVTTQTSGPVKDYYANTQISTSECGVVSYLVSDVLDQKGTKIANTGPFTLTEMFSNYSSTVSGLTAPPTQSSPQDTGTQRPADTHFFGTRAPSCPGQNDNETFDQSFSVKINGVMIPLQL